MTFLESLPNEILLLIFSYLHKLDVLYAFTTLNQRFQQIVLPYLSDIDLTNKNYPSYRCFRLFYEHILPTNAHYIRSLKLTGCNQLHLLQPHLRRFVNLNSLSMQNTEDVELHQFLTEVLSVPSLSELSMSLTRGDILTTVSSYASLNLNKITLIFTYFHLKFNNISSMPSIRQMTVYLKSGKMLADLFVLMPNLEELKLSILNFHDLDGTFQLSLPKTFSNLYLEFGGYNRFALSPGIFTMMQRFLKPFESQLRSLTIIALNLDDQDFFNDEKFPSLTQKFIQLENFAYDINVNHPPSCNLLFPNVKRLADSTYSIYTLPRPQRFVKTLVPMRYEAILNSDLTMKELFNCQILRISFRASPIGFELQNNRRLKNLQKIESGDSLDHCTSEMLQCIAKIIALSPNLNSVTFPTESNSTALLKACKAILPPAIGAQIKYTTILIFADFGGDRDPNSYSAFLTELSAIFPNSERLTLHIKPQKLSKSYTTFEQFLDDIRRKFQKLTHLILSIHLPKQETLQDYKSSLDKLSSQKVLYYTVVEGNRLHFYHIFTIWL